MEKEPMATFTVRIVSVEHGTWQGHAETENGAFDFRSEMELLRGLTERCPALLPGPCDWCKQENGEGSKP